MSGEQADARFWSRMARRYSRASIKDMAGYERTLERTAALVRGMERVLEIGCGTGTTALRLAPEVGSLLATDLSAEMIAIAREKPSTGPVTFEVAAPAAIAPESGPFDAILAFNVLHLLRDRPATYAHLRSLLKPGGLFISKTICLSEMNPLIRAAIPVMRAVRLAPYVSVFDAAALEAEIAQAGFSVMERAHHGSGRTDPRIFLVAQA